ncbi:hypothetical protein EV426DRAFT_588839 [Tirmania nivea]|nr:hypothetical protein EV426DRAFT_588839 [Tirmania nivea]
MRFSGLLWAVWLTRISVISVELIAFAPFTFAFSFTLSSSSFFFFFFFFRTIVISYGYGYGYVGGRWTC